MKYWTRGDSADQGPLYGVDEGRLQQALREEAKRRGNW